MTPTPSNPAEIARITLVKLISRRLPPLPENYKKVYDEVAGTSTAPVSASNPSNTFPELELRALFSALPKETASQKGFFRQIDTALKKRNWDACAKVLTTFFRDKQEEVASEARQGWRPLLFRLNELLEMKDPLLPTRQKKESFSRVLNASPDEKTLFERLQNLVALWSESKDIAGKGLPIPSIDKNISDALPSTQPLKSDESPAPELLGMTHYEKDFLYELRELLVKTLENLVIAQIEDNAEVAAQASNFGTNIRKAKTQQAISDLDTELKRLSFQMQFVIEDRQELNSGLLNILGLMLENFCELIDDDRWLKGQIDLVSNTIVAPLNLRSVNEAELRLKEVIYKQSNLKGSLSDAKNALKKMLTGFVDHLSGFVDSTSHYHEKIGTCVTRISQTNDIGELEEILAEIIQETRSIQLNTQRSHDDLVEMQMRVTDAENRINSLQEELDKASQLVRHDQLTGAFNRRGLEESFANEVARANRRGSTFCIALLDIDNFKKLNDSLGHIAGDEALIHLVTVVRETLRPQDTLSRFGGEEFIILLPDTPIDKAEAALIRLQRKLTKRIFLHEHEKVLITFSAGLTDYRLDDTFASATSRADEAMYCAKRSGKNKVVLL